MSVELHDALEISLAALRAGASLDACLDLFPDQRQVLLPLLKTAQELEQRGATQIPSKAATSSRTRFLAQAARLREQHARRPTGRFSPRLAFAALAVTLVVFVSGFTLLGVSAQALPGDNLYALKRSAENLTLALAPSNSAKDEMEKRYLTRRNAEVQSLLMLERPAAVSFEGIVTAQSPWGWVIDGIPVMLMQETEILSDISLGQHVRVEGTTAPQGWVEARRIYLTRFELIGLVESMGTQHWSIGGMVLRINSQTAIDPGIQLGEPALAFISTPFEGGLLAVSIMRLAPHPATPEPTPVMPPTATREPGVQPTSETVENPIEFIGPVESMQASIWRISGLTFTITPETEIESDIQIGDLVRALAVQTANGQWTALEIDAIEEGDLTSATPEGEDDPDETEQASPEPDEEATPEPEEQETPDGDGDEDDDEIEFEGVLQSINGNIWTIAGKQVLIDGDTRIEDDPEVGDEVRVRAIPLPNGQYQGLKIERE